MIIRELVPADRPRLRVSLTTSWGSTRVARLRELLDITDLDGLVAVEDEEWFGYASYQIDRGSMEIAVLESFRPNRGIASALVASCVAVALKWPLERVWLITTNDNLHALRFYQRRGFVLVALHRGNATWARQHLKSELPVLGLDDIPIRDELELELPRAAWPEFVARYGVPMSISGPGMGRPR